MTESEKSHGAHEEARQLPVLEAGPPTLRRREGDLVVDLSGVQELDVATLAVLMTAQQQAKGENRSVWLAGVPMKIWQALDAMGLGRFFKPFPVSEKVEV